MEFRTRETSRYTYAIRIGAGAFKGYTEFRLTFQRETQGEADSTCQHLLLAEVGVPFACARLVESDDARAFLDT